MHVALVLTDLPSFPHLAGDSRILESLIMVNHLPLTWEDNLKKSPAFLVFYLQHNSVGTWECYQKKTNKLSRHMSIDMCCTAEQECSECSLGRGVNYSEKSVRRFLGLENPGNFSRDSGIFSPNLRVLGFFSVDFFEIFSLISAFAELFPTFFATYNPSNYF